MVWFKKHKWLIFAMFIVIILIPLFLHCFIFENNFPSKVSNDGWAGFLGGYIGAIIGAITTIIAISMEIEQNKIEKQIDEINNIRPFLYTTIKGWCKSSKVSTEVEIQNLGFNAACSIKMYENDMDDTEHKCLIDSRFALSKDSTIKFNLCFDIKKTQYYYFEYYDIKSNLYRQTFKAVPKAEPYSDVIEHFIVLEPEMIRSKNFE